LSGDIKSFESELIYTQYNKLKNDVTFLPNTVRKVSHISQC